MDWKKNADIVHKRINDIKKEIYHLELRRNCYERYLCYLEHNGKHFPADWLFMIPMKTYHEEETKVPVIVEEKKENVFPVGSTIVELFVSCGLVKSKTTCRNLIKQGGAYVEGERITKDYTVDKVGKLALRAGKKHCCDVEIIDNVLGK